MVPPPARPGAVPAQSAPAPARVMEAAKPAYVKPTSFAAAAQAGLPTSKPKPPPPDRPAPPPGGRGAGEESRNQEVRVAEVAVDLVTYRTKTCLKARLFRLKLLISKACFLNLTKLENKRQTISASQNMKRTTSLIPCPRTRRKKKTEVRTFKEWRNKEKLIWRLLEEKARRIRAFTVAEEVVAEVEAEEAEEDAIRRSKIIFVLCLCCLNIYYKYCPPDRFQTISLFFCVY